MEESIPITKSLPPYEGCGIGRIVNLSKQLPLGIIIKNWCDYVKIPHLRVALPDNVKLDSPITSIAVCVGSGTIFVQNDFLIRFSR